MITRQQCLRFKKVESAAFLNPLVINKGAEAIMFDKYIKDWKPYQINRVIGIVRGGFATGMTTQQIVRDICGTKSAKYRDGALNKTRADIQGIVQTTIQHLSATAKAEFAHENDDLIIGVRNIATLDSKTSTQCFTGATRVTPVGEVKSLYRSKYEGEIFTLNLSSGEKIEGTPNHPILTQDGWTAMCEIDPSYHVVYSIGGDSFRVVGDDNVSVPRTIGELYDSVGELGGSEVFTKAPSATDFYGDGVGMNDKVDTLSSKCELRYNLKPCFGELIKNISLCNVHLSEILPCLGRLIFCS